MSAFTVPASSSPLPPSTPGSGQKTFRAFDGSGSHASTTPAGPPPSSVRSFTPAGPPPSSIFGSSQFGSAKTPSRSEPPFLANDAHLGGRLAWNQASITNGLSNAYAQFNNSTFALPDSSPTSQSDVDDQSLRGSDAQLNGSVSSGRLAIGSGQTYTGIQKDRIHRPQFDLFPTGEQGQLHQSSINNFSQLHTFSGSRIQGGVKRSRGGVVLSSNASQSRPTAAEDRDSAMPGIATTLASSMGEAPLKESDDLILGTEGLIIQLHDRVVSVKKDAERTSAALSNAVERLCDFWTSCRTRDLMNLPMPDDVMIGIGPDENAPLVHSAIYLSTLLLPLRHPSAAKGKQALAVTRLNRSLPSSQTPYSTDTPLNPTAFPKILLDWLDKNHNPFESTLAEVRAKKPNPTAHENYWDMLFMLAIRGKLSDLLQMLKIANFEHAATAKEDGHGHMGYQDEQLASIKRVIGRAVEVFQACPVLTEDNWHVTGNEWIMFRKLVEAALDDLATFAEGRDRDLDPESPAFEASNFGLSGMSNEITASSRRAESKVPWTIFQNLKTTYGILLGGSSEILSSSQDWVEATISLTAWWNGDDDDEITLSVPGGLKRSLRRSRSKGPRLVDHAGQVAYTRRMTLAFQRVTDDSEEMFMLPDSTKPVEIALACIFENNMQGLIGLLRGFSLPVADAFVEIASLGGWLESVPNSNILDDFDESDLMVLSSAAPPMPTDQRALVMTGYAEALFHRGMMANAATGQIEGWELSVAVLARLSSGEDKPSTKKIAEYFERLPLDSDEQIDKVFEICQDYNMGKEGRRITERYADAVLENSENYGTALVYYARAHKTKKIKDILDLLISYSLVQSSAFPAPSDLDPNLESLVTSPKESLEHLASIDEKAAEILHVRLSGYATLRRFYDLRDAQARAPKSTPSEDLTSQMIKPAKCLLAVINSAANPIQGGLYDESKQSVINVEGLLALLGEATVLVNQHPPVLTLPQCFSLLKAIEDLSTVTSRVFARCDDFFRSTLASHHGRAALASPRQLLHKQMSSLTSGGLGSGSGSFSLISSSMLEQSETSDGADMVMSLATTTTATTGDDDDGAADSRALVVKSPEAASRGWDWRDRVNADTSAEALLQGLRLGLAREIAAHWIGGGG